MSIGSLSSSGGVSENASSSSSCGTATEGFSSLDGANVSGISGGFSYFGELAASGLIWQ
jgi:hypothetical protein